MKHIKTTFALFALIIGLFLTFSHTAQAQDVPDGFDPDANSTVFSIAVQTDGKILIGGRFTTLDGGTVSRNRIARLGFAPTAASVTIGGRVSSDKRGIARAIVHITDQNGNIRTARTNPFGFYRFTDVEVAQVLIVNVFHKRYQFDTQVITPNESLTNLNFTAQNNQTIGRW